MGPVVRSPFQTTVFDASAIWTLCWVGWSWFSKLIWNGLLAGASRLSLSNLMPDATRLSAAAGLPAAEPDGMGLAALAAGLAPALGDADDAAEGDGEHEKMHVQGAPFEQFPDFVNRKPTAGEVSHQVERERKPTLA